MGTARFILKTANAIVSLIIILALCTAGIYAIYALWDNSRVYAAADDVQADMLKLKPEAGGETPSFEELLKVNPDVRGWVALDNTRIDYPVLQGKTNLSYINTDVYGNFSLAGSIFLDSRNNRAFEDPYSLLYGHYMDNSKMFGDLELYKDEAFFKENRTGTLILPDRVYDLEIYACLIVSASEDSIFDPGQWQGNIDELIQFTENNALYLNKAAMERKDSMDEEPQFLAFTTCTSEFTDARTAILAVMKPSSAVN
jgi:sortase B